MKTKIESITPAIAAAILKNQNTHNRPVRQRAVDEYANEMTNGRWALTHQGIAIDENNMLLDGQHRLLAVQQSGVTVDIQVTRGIPAKVSGNGVFTMDVIDSGRTRKTADQLHLLHGVEQANVTVASLRIIGRICFPALSSQRLSVGQAKALLAIYGEQIAEMIATIGQFRPMRRGPVIGTLAFCAKCSPQISAFAASAASGESLRSGDPALALRNHLTNHLIPANTKGQQTIAEWVGNAACNAIGGQKLSSVRRGPTGIDYFKTKQRSNVEKVRAIFGAE